MKIYITNLNQCNYYLANGIAPIEVIKNKDGNYCFVFLKESTNRIYLKWKQLVGKEIY